MSCGIGHMCITIGIAEAIAIRMIVTANIFAISPRLLAGIVRPFLNNAAAYKRCGGLDFEIVALVLRSTLSVLYFALKVKSAFADPPAATVTFWFCVPAASCQAVTV